MTRDIPIQAIAAPAAGRGWLSANNRPGLSGALCLMALLGMPMTANAAQVSEVKAFSAFASVTAPTPAFLTGTSTSTTSASGKAQVTFQPFTSALGEITGVRLELRSVASRHGAASVFLPTSTGFGHAYSETRIGASVALEGVTLASLSTPPLLTSCPGDAVNGGCLAALHDDYGFDRSFDFVDFSAFTAGPLTFDLPYLVNVIALFAVLDPTATALPQFGAAGALDWSGDATITYTYAERPAAVPEPAAWISLLLGFGAMGAFIRRQRSVQAA